VLNPANISSDHIPDNLGVRSTGNLSPGATSFEEIMEFHVAEVWNAEVDGIITLVVTRSFASDHKEGSGLGNLTHDLRIERRGSAGEDEEVRSEISYNTDRS